MSESTLINGAQLADPTPNPDVDPDSNKDPKGDRGKEPCPPKED